MRAWPGEGDGVGGGGGGDNSGGWSEIPSDGVVGGEGVEGEEER